MAKINTELHDKIEAYLDGQMSEPERQAFEQQIGQDTGLAELVATHRLEREMMDVMLDNDLRQEMAEWQKEKDRLPPLVEKKSAGNRPPFRPWLLVLAALALSALALWWLRVPAPAPPPKDKEQAEQQLEKPAEAPETSPPAGQEAGPEDEPENTRPEDPGPVAREDMPAPQQPAAPSADQLLAAEFSRNAGLSFDFERGEAAATPWDSAAVLLQKEDFEQALPLLARVPPSSGNFTRARLNAGLIHLQNGNFPAAIPFLKTAAENKRNRLWPRGEYYLALAYLGAGQLQDFERMAVQIQGFDGHPHGEDLKRLLSRREGS